VGKEEDGVLCWLGRESSTRDVEEGPLPAMEGESEGELDGEERAHVMENRWWCAVEESKQGTLRANMKAATSGERSQVALWVQYAYRVTNEVSGQSDVWIVSLP
jgi:hypothetical protein